MRFRTTLGALTLMFVFSSFAHAAKPQTFLTLNSQPGDYIGGGGSGLIRLAALPQ
jgi:hypothetical protein